VIPSLFAFLRRLRPFHFGSVSRGGPRPLGLWISSGTDMGRIEIDTPRSFLNVTLFGRFRGRVYEKELR
jgi:hypothetical protein